MQLAEVLLPANQALNASGATVFENECGDTILLDFEVEEYIEEQRESCSTVNESRAVNVVNANVNANESEQQVATVDRPRTPVVEPIECEIVSCRSINESEAADVNANDSEQQAATVDRPKTSVVEPIECEIISSRCSSLNDSGVAPAVNVDVKANDSDQQVATVDRPRTCTSSVVEPTGSEIISSRTAERDSGGCSESCNAKNTNDLSVAPTAIDVAAAFAVKEWEVSREEDRHFASSVERSDTDMSLPRKAVSGAENSFLCRRSLSVGCDALPDPDVIKNAACTASSASPSTVADNGPGGTVAPAVSASVHCGLAAGCASASSASTTAASFRSIWQIAPVPSEGDSHSLTSSSFQSSPSCHMPAAAGALLMAAAAAASAAGSKGSAVEKQLNASLPAGNCVPSSKEREAVTESPSRKSTGVLVPHQGATSCAPSSSATSAAVAQCSASLGAWKTIESTSALAWGKNPGAVQAQRSLLLGPKKVVESIPSVYAAGEAGVRAKCSSLLGSPKVVESMPSAVAAGEHQGGVRELHFSLIGSRKAIEFASSVAWGGNAAATSDVKSAAPALQSLAAIAKAGRGNLGEAGKVANAKAAAGEGFATTAVTLDAAGSTRQESSATVSTAGDAKANTATARAARVRRKKTTNSRVCKTAAASAKSVTAAGAPPSAASSGSNSSAMQWRPIRPSLLLPSVSLFSVPTAIRQNIPAAVQKDNAQSEPRCTVAGFLLPTCALPPGYQVTGTSLSLLHPLRIELPVEVETRTGVQLSACRNSTVSAPPGVSPQGSELIESSPSSAADSLTGGPPGLRASSATNVPDKQQKSVPEEQQKGVPKEQQKSVPKEQQKIVPKEQHKSVPEEQQKSVPDKQQKSVPDKQQKSVPDKQQKSVPEEQQKSVPEDQQKSVPEEQRKSSDLVSPSTCSTDDRKRKLESTENSAAHSNQAQKERKCACCGLRFCPRRPLREFVKH